MRIISGKFKGRSLVCPKGSLTRPTSGMVREAVFNIIQNEVEDAVFLDLFAGSGAMGLEALSRGAKSVLFLENNPSALQAVSKNIQAFDVSKQSSIMAGNLLVTLDRLQGMKRSFSIIFADPPYDQKGEEKKNQESISVKTLKKLDSSTLLEDGGILILEESKICDFETFPLNSLQFIRRRDFGNSSLFIFSRKFTEMESV